MSYSEIMDLSGNQDTWSSRREGRKVESVVFQMRVRGVTVSGYITIRLQTFQLNNKEISVTQDYFTLLLSLIIFTTN